MKIILQSGENKTYFQKPLSLISDKTNTIAVIATLNEGVYQITFRVKSLDIDGYTETKIQELSPNNSPIEHVHDGIFARATYIK